MAYSSSRRWLPRLHWRLDRRTLARAIGWVALVLYAAIAIGSLGRAYNSDGGLSDRQLELARVEHQLADAKSRTERYRSQIDAFDKDAEVRMGVIRRELGMLRPDERFVIFK